MTQDEEYHTLFPYRLHQVLSMVERENLSHLISWLPCGSRFKIHDAQGFTSLVMPRIGRCTRYKSFLRQLSMYKFHRCTSGPLRGTYHHPYFRRSKPELCRGVMRNYPLNDDRMQTAPQAPNESTSPRRTEFESPTRALIVEPPRTPDIVLEEHSYDLSKQVGYSAQSRVTVPTVSPQRNDEAQTTVMELPAEKMNGNIWDLPLESTTAHDFFGGRPTEGAVLDDCHPTVPNNAPMPLLSLSAFSFFSNSVKDEQTDRTRVGSRSHTCVQRQVDTEDLLDEIISTFAPRDGILSC